VTNGPNVTIHSPFTEGVIGNLSEFGADTMELAQLQAQLTVADLKACVGRATVPLALGGVGLILVLGLVPIALAGVALLIAEPLGLSLGLALLITAGATLLLAGILAFLALRGVRASLRSFDRSSDEFTRNLAWIKTVLSNSSRMPPKSKGAGRWSFMGR